MSPILYVASPLSFLNGWVGWTGPCDFTFSICNKHCAQLKHLTSKGSGICYQDMHLCYTLLIMETCTTDKFVWTILPLHKCHLNSGIDHRRRPFSLASCWIRLYHIMWFWEDFTSATLVINRRGSMDDLYTQVLWATYTYLCRATYTYLSC